ncbi:imidazole glycerol phosphate synthase subunit HisH [Halalkalibacillus halophilus]|uniref:imidazole glycerol phosphate synthase subunit HisH n=1 Tax=Halalkalibacillus halophilus TaxID=392827 RepID=UPI00041F8330|nr:imidazole glycerol phosphate synthase subunit HisH [Halalkalibacillus halophilus]
MIAIIDYGAGNLKSVRHALKELEIEAFITTNPEELEDASGIILPGVGAFGEAIEQLEHMGFIEVIKDQVDRGKPLLGICLGMQLLFDKSFEYGKHKGLGLIPGDIVRFESSVKVPHIGWNQLEVTETYIDDLINENIMPLDYVYFVHSYFANPHDQQDILFQTEYGQTFPSAVKRDHVIGMQFHPEKSGRVGKQLLLNFGEMTK